MYRKAPSNHHGNGIVANGEKTYKTQTTTCGKVTLKKQVFLKW